MHPCATAPGNLSAHILLGGDRGMHDGHNDLSQPMVAAPGDARELFEISSQARLANAHIAARTRPCARAPGTVWAHELRGIMKDKKYGGPFARMISLPTGSGSARELFEISSQERRHRNGAEKNT